MRLFSLLLVLFSLSLFAFSDSDVLRHAVALEKSSTSSGQSRAYDDYKKLYIKALMHNNNWLRLESLKGIIRTGKRLHIDVSNYKKELAKSSHTKRERKSSHTLQSIRWKNGNLELTFNKKLRNNQVNYYKKYDSVRKMYQYIFNINAFMTMRSKTFRKNGINRIKISKYTPHMLHLVIENSSPLSVHFSKKLAKIIVRISSNKIVHNRVQYKHRMKSSRINRNKIIVIDPGHGGKDPGAIGYKGYKEKNVVLAIGKYLRTILKARGYKVYMTRSSDYFVKLRNRTQFANKKHADIFISIHANAVGKQDIRKTYGLETYYLSKSRSNRAKRVAAIENSSDLVDMNYYAKESFLNTLNSHNIIAANKLAIDLQRSILASLKSRYRYIKDDGVREGPFWVLVGAQMPAVLIETGFITNPREAKRLVNKTYEKRLAKGIADGVERYFINCRKRGY
ncbi:N-acetylmuramoyl-L-alanine amidase [hydrothermal vent metagenome]|uniref:N-acetylmuramoyl-L-alanine amidase n=1 Tax=hydrothermal vent metagenome TaxID=652676 RepID=A0A1W1CKT6_9ZZZZ